MVKKKNQVTHNSLRRDLKNYELLVKIRILNELSLRNKNCVVIVTTFDLKIQKFATSDLLELRSKEIY